MNNRTDPILYIVIPCYNEQEVLPITAPMFLQKINDSLIMALPPYFTTMVFP